MSGVMEGECLSDYDKYFINDKLWQHSFFMNNFWFKKF